MDSLVSIIIPTYKNCDKLPIAIDSALNQSYKNIEVIVVDDNHPDSDYRLETEKIISRYSDSRLKYIQNIVNSERSASRNNGVNASEGDYIVFLDNDDYIFPEKIESQLKCLESKDSSYAICYSRYIRTLNGKVVWRSSEQKEGDGLFTEFLSRNMPIHPGSNLMIRKDAFKLTNGFKTSMNYNEDIDLLLQLFSLGYKIAYCDVLGLNVMLHDHGPSFDFWKITEDYMCVEKEYIDALNHKEKIKFMKLIGLQLIKFYLRKNFKKAMEAKRKFKVSLLDMLKYACYALRRRIRGEAYGFSL